ncbi:MAG TPA: L,D-transpeptidase [Gemmatimonadaceae bacterium]|nr:L,D-transpeptidase [Gemmatimonadaceae bacterium]
MQSYRRKAIRAAALTAGFVSLTGMAIGGATLRDPDRAATVRMVADLSDKILYVYEADTVAKMYDISDGKDPYPTPRGSFTVRKLHWNPSWRPPDSEWAKNKTAKGPGEKGNPMKVVKIFFKEPDYYIHGTADIASLGSADSHGCLRMSPEDVTELGKWVLEHGGQWRGENWFMRILHSRRQEKVIFLSTPVSLSIVE